MLSSAISRVRRLPWFLRVSLVQIVYWFLRLSLVQGSRFDAFLLGVSVVRLVSADMAMDSLVQWLLEL